MRCSHQAEPQERGGELNSESLSTAVRITHAMATAAALMTASFMMRRSLKIQGPLATRVQLVCCERLLGSVRVS